MYSSRYGLEETNINLYDLTNNLTINAPTARIYHANNNKNRNHDYETKHSSGISFQP